LHGLFIYQASITATKAVPFPKWFVLVRNDEVNHHLTLRTLPEPVDQSDLFLLCRLLFLRAR